MDFELQARYTYLGQECQNNWVFRSINGQPTSAILAEAFEIGVWTPLMLITVQDVVGTTMVIKNLDNPADFGEFPYVFTPAGQDTGSAMPSYCTSSITYLRPQSDIRNGYKRFSGLPKSEVLNNALSSGYRSNLGTVVDAIQQGFSNTNQDATFIAVYRATPKGTQVQQTFVPSGFAIPNRVGTQNTRKAGIGQ